MKKYSFVFIAMVFALISAFTFRPAFSTFVFQGDTTDPLDRTDPLEYQLNTMSCGDTETSLCTIEAEADDDDRPIIPVNSQLYTALDNGGSTTGPDFLFTGIQGKNP